MKKNLLLLIISLIFYNVSFSQQFTSRILDTTANVFTLNPEQAIRISKAERQSNSRYKTPPKYDKTMMMSLQNVTSRMPSSDVGIPYLNQTPPSDMTDKYVLKPSPGNLSKGLPSLAEDLHNGKVNVNIPFFEFEYFDYKIPVSINNRYPQVIEGSHNEPTFYINSNVGGDWTLSIDQFKVSRQINGVEDEHPTKGYFSSFSQSKIYNPETISDEDIHNGLKGNWDPAIDIYHYSTPTVSGSFLLNLPNGEYEILSGDKVHIEFDLVNNELREFTIKDNGGHKYIFGGDSSTIEVSQSISDVFSFGMFKDANYNKKTVTHIIEVDYNNEPISFATLPINANLFVYNDLPFPMIPLTVEEVFQSIQQHDSIDSIKDFLTLVGSKGVGYDRREYYAVIDFYADPNVSLLTDGDTYNDPDMKRHKVNTGWYLKEIVLHNSKKINLMYYNTIWQAYQTFSSNKMKINMITSGNDYPFHYIKQDGTVVSLYNLDMYACFPKQLTFMQFPINETHTVTTNFIKSPVLLKIYDEDDFSTVNLSYFNYKPYVRKPDIFLNAPAETLNNNDSSNNYGLLKKITFTKSGSQQNEVIFNNHTEFGYYNSEGTTYSEPHKDRSYLSSCVVNGTRKYNFDYAGSRLKRIHYPTGGTKQFFNTNTSSNYTRSYYNLGNGSNPPGYYYGLHEARVDSIMTTSENNSMTEKFVYENRSYSIGAYSAKKTYRPDIASCTSGARLYSTSPVYNSHSTKSGSAYLNVEKYINNELQFSSEFSDQEYTGNTLRLTNESIPGYLSTVGRPPTFLDEKKGYLNRHTIYKTNTEVIIFNVVQVSIDHAHRLLQG